MRVARQSRKWEMGIPKLPVSLQLIVDTAGRRQVAAMVQGTFLVRVVLQGSMAGRRRKRKRRRPVCVANHGTLVVP